MYFKKSVTFFYTDKSELHNLDPILKEAKLRGYEVRNTSNVTEKAEIGVYCQHECFPQNSKLSIILLHDIAQGHNRWPNIWEGEPWNKFDIGILPGHIWEKRWQKCSWHPFTRTKRGVYKLGWPKSDIIFQNEISFKKETEEIRSKLDLKHEKTILYAPSWENDGKQDEFVQSLKDLPVNLLLKQAPFTDSYPDILENIRIMNDLHRNLAPNIHIIDSAINIMHCIGMSDIIVSDESSVMFEGLFLDVPSIAVTDWKIPDCFPPRYAIFPDDFVYKTKLYGLKDKAQDMISNIHHYRNEIRKLKEESFVNLGKSSQKIMDLIDNLVQTNNIDMKPVVPRHDLKSKWVLIKMLRQYLKMKSWFKIRLNINNLKPWYK